MVPIQSAPSGLSRSTVMLFDDSAAFSFVKRLTSLPRSRHRPCRLLPIHRLPRRSSRMARMPLGG